MIVRDTFCDIQGSWMGVVFNFVFKTKEKAATV